MNTRVWLNLAMVVLVAVLGLVLYYEPGIETPPAPLPITDKQADEFSRIEVVRAGRDPLLLERKEGHWEIVAKTRIPAAPTQVQALLGLPAQTPAHRYPVSEVDLSQLELDPPNASIIFNNELRFDFGGTEPLEGNRYVRSGDTVFVLSDLYQHLVQGGVATFASRRLVPEGAQIRALEFHDFALRLGDDGRWQLDPDDKRVGADALTKLVSRWREGSALWVRKLEPLEKPRESVRVFLVGVDEPLRFRVVTRDPELILARPDFNLQYHFGPDAAQDLLSLGQDATPAAEGATSATTP